MSTPVVDPPLFRRRRFEAEWLSPPAPTSGTDPLGGVLAEEARRWLALGTQLGYFSAGPHETPSAENTDQTAARVVDWIRTIQQPDGLTGTAFALALADAREDLTSERRELLAKILFAPDEEWKITIRRAFAVADRLSMVGGRDRATLESVAWVLSLTSEEPDADTEAHELSLPAGWRQGQLTQLVAIVPDCAHRVDAVREARDAILAAALSRADPASGPAPYVMGSAEDDGDASGETVSNSELLAELDSLSPQSFDAAIANLLATQGHSEITPTTDADFGADFLTLSDGDRTVVQVRRGWTAVGPDAVRHVVGAEAFWEADRALVITTSFFTSDAEVLASLHGVELVDRTELKAWLGHGPPPLTHDLTPWPHQVAALARLRAGRRQSESRALVVMAPGLGKTYVAALDVQQLEQEVGRRLRVLYISHQVVILDQARQAFLNIFRDGRTYGRFDGDSHDFHSDFVFATFQSLYRSLTELLPTAFDYVVVDEAHHTAARTRDAVVNHLRPLFLLGLTATPIRGDGKDIAPYYGDFLAASLPLEQAMAEGLLTSVDYRVLSDRVDRPALSEALAGRIDIHRINGDLFQPVSDEVIVETVMHEASVVDGARRILVFCESLQQMDHYAGLFPGARTISSRDGRSRQIKTVEDLRAGAFEVLLSRDVLNEGIDIPHASTLVFLRNTESHVVFLQQLGRGLRKLPGKPRVDVFDFVNTVSRIQTVYQFFSRLEAVQAGERRLGDDARSAMTLDRTALDVVRGLLQRKKRGGAVADLAAIGLVISRDLSSASLRRMVAAGRLVPDFVMPGAASTSEVLFERRSVERVMRQVRSPKYTVGLIKDQDFAKSVGRSTSAVRAAQRRGELPAAWVHLKPTGQVDYYFEPDDAALLSS